MTTSHSDLRSQQSLKSENLDSRALLSHWVDEHSDAMYRFALKRLSDQHEIEDLLQDTFLAAVRAKESFRGDSSVRTWLIAILRLKIVDYFRKQSRSREVGTDKSLDQFARQEPVNKWNCSAPNTVENEEFWGALQSCLEKLPASLSQAFFLLELDGNTPQFVCHALGISPENLNVRLFRARSALRDCLNKNWFTNH